MRKTILYMDLTAVEYGENLNPVEQLTRERLCTTKDWDRLIFWMDIEFSLKLLTRFEYNCFVLSFIEGYTDREIALRINMSHQAISKQTNKARKKIRNFLKEAY